MLKRLLDLIPGVDRIIDALNPEELTPSAKIAAWCFVAAVLATGWVVLS